MTTETTTTTGGFIRATGTEAEVILDISRRQAAGINKYGTTVRDNPLELMAWVQHAYEEALDLAIYLKRILEQMDKDNEEGWCNGK